MAVIAQTPATLDIVAVKGDDLTVTLSVTESSVAYNWTGATVATAILDSTGATVATNFTTATPANGTLTMSLTDTNTTTLGVGSYRYWLSVTKSSSTRTWLAGLLTVMETGWGGTSSSSASLSITTGSATLSLSGQIAATSSVSNRTPVASRAMNGVQSNQLTDGTVTSGTFRSQHVMTSTATDLRLWYSNSYNLNGVDTNGLNSITVRASIEAPDGTCVPVFFNGSRSIILEPGAEIASNPVGVEFAKGTSFYVRSYVSVSAGEKWPLNILAVAANGEGDNRGVGASDLTLSGSISTNSLRLFSPCRIDGISKVRNAASVGIAGDSIACGGGAAAGTDTDIGFIVRALNGNFNYQNVAMSSDASTRWTLLWRSARKMARITDATVIVSNMGINDIATTLATMQSRLLAYWTILAARGVPLWQTTVTPYTTSTDSWATTANQTVTANEATRTGFNDWLRDGAPISGGVAVAVGTANATRAGESGHPLAGYFEIADLAETSRNSGKWRSVGSGESAAFTADGIHPNGFGSAAIAVGINLTSIGQTTV